MTRALIIACYWIGFVALGVSIWCFYEGDFSLGVINLLAATSSALAVKLLRA